MYPLTDETNMIPPRFALSHLVPEDMSQNKRRAAVDVQ